MSRSILHGRVVLAFYSQLSHFCRESKHDIFNNIVWSRYHEIIFPVDFNSIIHKLSICHKEWVGNRELIVEVASPLNVMRMSSMQGLTGDDRSWYKQCLLSTSTRSLFTILTIGSWRKQCLDQESTWDTVNQVGLWPRRGASGIPFSRFVPTP